jgi:hypothetical protein
MKSGASSSSTPPVNVPTRPTNFNAVRDNVNRVQQPHTPSPSRQFTPSGGAAPFTPSPMHGNINNVKGHFTPSPSLVPLGLRGHQPQFPPGSHSPFHPPPGPHSPFQHPPGPHYPFSPPPGPRLEIVNPTQSLLSPQYHHRPYMYFAASRLPQHIWLEALTSPVTRLESQHHWKVFWLSLRHRQ